MRSALFWLCAFCALSFFSGCAQKEPKPIKQPQIAQEIEQPKRYTSPGSIYNGYDNLFSDVKAYDVGDIITIKVVENIKGSGSTDTKTSRNHNMDLSIPAPTIMDKKIPNETSLFGIKQQSTNSFQGKGGTNRSARLIATITARVVKVYPNGNLYIVGKKYIKINDDTQVLKISGIVNPSYIEPDNTIDSSKIADMYVEYNGEGFMTQTQRPGWLANFLMKIWPF